MKFVIECIKGIAIGAGAILPGISSGVLCVIFGIYDKLINSILNFFKNPKSNFLFLLPIIIGMFIGIFLFGNILIVLFNLYHTQTSFCIIGLILGSIPSLIKQANQSNGFKLHFIIYTIITFLCTLILMYFENKLSNINIITNTNFIFLLFSGFIMSIGVVFPGVSSTALLMILGTYNLYLFAIATIDLHVLIPMGIGFTVGCIIFLKIMKYCLTKFYQQTYYAIIGFVIGSIIILCPEFSINLTSFVSIILAIISFYIAKMLENV